MTLALPKRPVGPVRAIGSHIVDDLNRTIAVCVWSEPSLPDCEGTARYIAAMLNFSLAVFAAKEPKRRRRPRGKQS